MRWQILVGLLILGVLLGDVAAKEYAIRGNPWLAVLAVALDATAFACWVSALRQGALLSTGSVIFSVASAILAVLVGVALYREPVAPHQWAGMGLGVIALGLVTWEG